MTTERVIVIKLGSATVQYTHSNFGGTCTTDTSDIMPHPGATKRCVCGRFILHSGGPV